MRYISIFNPVAGRESIEYDPGARRGQGFATVSGLFDFPDPTKQLAWLTQAYGPRVPLNAMLHVEVDEVSWYYQGWLFPLGDTEFE